MKVINMLKRMMWKIALTDTTPVESITAVQSMLFGLWLILPFDTFDSGSVFDIMGQIAPETTWGILMTILGVSQLYVVHLKRAIYRIWVTRIMLPVWLIIDLSFLLSRTASSASVTYFVFVMCSVWSLISLALRQNRGCH